MKVVQVKCPSCQTPIHMKQKDILYYCENCKTIHIRDGGINVIDYEVADFRPGVEGDRVYVPFWRLYCSFVIHSSQVEGGAMFKLSGWVKGGQGNSGSLFVFVPAADFDPATFKRLSTSLTVNPLRYASRLDFGNVPRLPAALSRPEAFEMADFVVVTLEAEKPGVLQTLDYTLTVNDARLVYLPFVSTPNGLMPGA
jgi:hypothetical protein